MMQSRSKARATRGAVARTRSGVVAASVVATGWLVWSASNAAAFPYATCDDAPSPTVPAPGDVPSAPPSVLDPDRVRQTLGELVEQQRIDDAIRKRALDVLFSPVERSDNDKRLYEIFRRLLLAEGETREDLLRRLSNDIVRALDPVLRSKVWEVAKDEGSPRVNALLAVEAPEHMRSLDSLLQSLPLQVRDPETGIIFRLVPGGYMTQADGTRGEFVEPFYIANTEVDWCDWFRFSGGDKASSMPVEGLAWVEVDDFVRRAHLSLPTRAEWEFAARSGVVTEYWMGNPIPGEIRCSVDAAGRANVRDQTEFRRNHFDLYHVHGNVAEWCAHPLGRSAGMQPACGGSYLDLVTDCKATSVKMLAADAPAAATAVGFRPIRRIDGQTRVVASGARPRSVVVVDDSGPLDLHWRAKVVKERPDPSVDGLNPAYYAAVVDAIEQNGLPWQVQDLETGVRLQLMPPGEFVTRGSDGYAFRVLIKHPYYLGESEVTREEWDRMVGAVGPRETAMLPVDGKAWSECKLYLSKARAGLRFPNEFEWEWACTFGSDQDFAWEDDALVRQDRLRCNHRRTDEAKAPLIRSGGMLASPLGFRGLHGNAREWCNNRFTLPDLVPELEDRPRGGDAGVAMRGGGAQDELAACKAWARMGRPLDSPIGGLRIARSVPARREQMVAEWPAGAVRIDHDIDRPRDPKPSELTPADPSAPGGSANPSSEPVGPSAAPTKPPEQEPTVFPPPGGPMDGNQGSPGRKQAKPGGGNPNTPSGDPDDGQLPPDMPEGPVETSSGGG